MLTMYNITPSCRRLYMLEHMQQRAQLRVCTVGLPDHSSVGHAHGDIPTCLSRCFQASQAAPLPPLMEGEVLQIKSVELTSGKTSVSDAQDWWEPACTYSLPMLSISPYEGKLCL